MSEKTKKILYFAFPLLILLVYVFLRSSSVGDEPFSRSQYVLDTLTTIKIYDYRSSADSDVQKVFEVLRSYESVFNFYDEKSELSSVNNAIEKNLKAKPSKELLNLLEFSLKMYSDTGGKFDPCLGRLTNLWAFDKGGVLPKKKDIEGALSFSGGKWVTIKDGYVYAKKPVKFDLGGVAKGWAVDRAADFLEKKGYRKFLINTVSSTYVYNTLDSKTLNIGIDNPRGSGVIAVIHAGSGETISTSADNQKFFIKNGRRYHHILDPETGYPAKGFITVTVVAKKSAAWTDAVSTAIFVMDEREALQFARKNKVKLFAVTSDDKKIIYPRGSWIEILDE